MTCQPVFHWLPNSNIEPKESPTSTLRKQSAIFFQLHILPLLPATHVTIGQRGSFYATSTPHQFTFFNFLVLTNFCQSDTEQLITFNSKKCSFNSMKCSYTPFGYKLDSCAMKCRHINIVYQNQISYQVMQ